MFTLPDRRIGARSKTRPGLLLSRCLRKRQLLDRDERLRLGRPRWLLDRVVGRPSDGAAYRGSLVAYRLPGRVYRLRGEERLLSNVIDWLPENRSILGKVCCRLSERDVQWLC